MAIGLRNAERARTFVIKKTLMNAMKTHTCKKHNGMHLPHLVLLPTAGLFESRLTVKR